MKNMKLAAPWYTYRNMVAAMFEGDADVNVGEIVDDVDGYNYYFDLAVTNHEKAVALDKVLRKEKMFGNICLGIGVVNESPEAQKVPDVEVFKTALKGNKHLKDIMQPVDPAGQEHSFVRFWPEVVQFYNDDQTDYNGNWNGLAEDIAREIFNNRRWNIQFCTASKKENESSREFKNLLNKFK